MADTKLTGLGALAVVAAGDLIAGVDDPGGTPISVKIDVDVLDTYLSATAKALTNKTLGGDLAAGGFDITKIGVATMTEQAAANADVAGDGQLWVKTATPNELWFTDDAGTDFQVSGVEVTGTSGQIVVYDGSNVATAVTMSGAVAIDNAGATTVPITFDLQFSIDITDGNGDYVIHDDTIFGYEIDSINACLLDVATSTATITVKINTTAVTGISVSATTTKQTTADPSTAASTVVATDEVSITVASVANSPTLLTGVLHCTRTLA